MGFGLYGLERKVTFEPRAAGKEAFLVNLQKGAPNLKPRRNTSLPGPLGADWGTAVPFLSDIFPWDVVAPV